LDSRDFQNVVGRPTLTFHVHTIVFFIDCFGANDQLPKRDLPAPTLSKIRPRTRPTTDDRPFKIYKAILKAPFLLFPGCKNFQFQLSLDGLSQIFSTVSGHPTGLNPVQG
jgi:hypothetical protein